MKMLVEKRSFNIEEESISVDIGVRLNIEAYRSLSWVIKLTRILLVNTSEAY